MQNSKTTSKTNLRTLPNDIKALILEYLSLNDLHNFQYVSRDFYLLLKKSPRLWIKYLFLQCLDPQSDENALWETELYEERLPVNEETINFASMKESRSIIEKRFSLEQKFQIFLNHFLLSKQVQNLTKKLFDSFQKPISPSPCLKRENQIVSVHSVFQNFLTEIYFEVQPRPVYTDRMQTLMEEVIEKMKSSSNDDSIELEKLISLRWYSFDFIKTLKWKKDTLSDSQGTNIEHQIPTNDHKCSDDDHNEEITAKDEKINKDLELMGKFYDLIYSVIVNHCESVMTCLKAIKTDLDILNEYNRYWQAFVFTTIELNNTFQPFSRYFNEIYDCKCKELPHFPEFSIWRIMVKVWIHKVYAPLSDRLHRSFKSIIDCIRHINGPKDLFENAEHQATVPKEEEEKEACHLHAEDPMTQVLKQKKEKAIALLKKFYQAESDLSYDEVNVFFEDCIPTPNNTPLSQLEEVINSDTSELYQICKEQLFTKPEEVASFFRKDVELVESLFGKEAIFRTQEAQLAVLKDSLESQFNTVLKEVDLANQEDNDSSSSSNYKGSQESYCLNFAGLIKFLQPSEEIVQKIQNNKKFRDVLCKKIGKRCSHFNSFLRLMLNLADNLQHEYEECQHNFENIVQRGFQLVDERYKCLFDLNKDPECKDLFCLMNKKNKEKVL